MFRSSTDEVTTGCDTSECGQTSGFSPNDTSGIKDSTSYDIISSSSHQSVEEGSSSSSHGTSPQHNSGYCYMLARAVYANTSVFAFP